MCRSGKVKFIESTENSNVNLIKINLVMVILYVKFIVNTSNVRQVESDGQTDGEQ